MPRDVRAGLRPAWHGMGHAYMPQPHKNYTNTVLPCRVGAAAAGHSSAVLCCRRFAGSCLALTTPPLTGCACVAATEIGTAPSRQIPSCQAGGVVHDMAFAVWPSAAPTNQQPLLPHMASLGMLCMCAGLFVLGLSVVRARQAVAELQNSLVYPSLVYPSCGCIAYVRVPSCHVLVRLPCPATWRVGLSKSVLVVTRQLRCCSGVVALGRPSIGCNLRDFVNKP